MHWNVLHIIFYILLLFTIFYGGFGLTLYLMQPKLTYRPIREVLYTPEEIGLDFEDLTLKTEDGIELSAWYIPAPDAKYTVLLCHGNGGNIMHRLDNLNIFYNLGVNCLIFDYRGYGNSQGKPTEQGTYNDAMAAYKWLTEQKKIAPQTIIVYGQSLGGSVAAWLASQVQIGSLVLENAFTSYLDLAKKFYWYMPVQFFVRYKYDTLQYIANVHCPILVIHSRDDEIVPFEFGQRLHQAAKGPKQFTEISGGHNDGFLVSIDIYRDAWRKWLIYVEEISLASKQNKAS